MHARTLVFRTVEDPTVEVGPDDCRLVGANLFLGGRIVPLDDDGRLGVALACAALTEPLVRDVVVPFAAEFRFDDGGTYAADGTARVVDADVPAAGIVQAACALRLTSGPPGVIGGTATSASVFDPAGVLGAGTGSVWTINAYFDD